MNRSKGNDIDIVTFTSCSAIVCFCSIVGALHVINTALSIEWRYFLRINALPTTSPVVQLKTEKEI